MSNPLTIGCSTNPPRRDRPNGFQAGRDPRRRQQPEWVGDGSKPWYLVNPKIAGKWMFISLKMVSIDIDPSPVDPNPFQLDFLLRLPQVSGKLHAALADKARPAPSPTRPLTQQQGSRSEMPATGSARNGSTSLVKWTEYHGMCMSTQFFRGFSA